MNFVEHGKLFDFYQSIDFALPEKPRRALLRIAGRGVSAEIIINAIKQQDVKPLLALSGFGPANAKRLREFWSESQNDH